MSPNRVPLLSALLSMTTSRRAVPQGDSSCRARHGALLSTSTGGVEALVHPIPQLTVVVVWYAMNSALPTTPTMPGNQAVTVPSATPGLSQ